MGHPASYYLSGLAAHSVGAAGMDTVTLYGARRSDGLLRLGSRHAHAHAHTDTGSADAPLRPRPTPDERGNGAPQE